ncbi:uncharacterized protein [Magallana gigas]|uniref:uncharacterized protein n=1 Tax=Magallana gigas TaxID=29159 RepID=UPI003342DB7B
MDILSSLYKTVIVFQLSRWGFSSETPTTLPALQRNVCLIDAIHIHDELIQKGCPYSLIGKDNTNCTIPCIVELENDNSYHDHNHGIDYMIFNLRNNISISHKKFLDVSECIIKTITVRCDFKYHKDRHASCLEKLRHSIHETGSGKLNTQNYSSKGTRQKNRTESVFAALQEDGTLPGSLIGLIGAVIGCLIGVVLTLFGGWIIKTLRQRHLHQENLDLYPTSQSIYNPAVYTEIEELRMLVKATQVPSLEDNSPLSARSKTSNTYYTLAEMGSLGKSTILIQDIGSDKLRTSNHSFNVSRQSLSSCCSVKKDEQQRESGDSKKYFQLEQQELT